jgi:hypothetical protein
MKKFLITMGLCLTLLIAVAIPAAAKEASAGAPLITEVTEAESEGEDNIFLTIYDEVTSHLPELFSALSLLGAAIIAFCYKRGLLPLLKNGIGAIGSAAMDCGKKAESYAEESRNLCEKANDSIHFITTYMKKIEEDLYSLDEKISAVCMQKKEKEVMRELMHGQIDMLLEIFLASSLPQFEKDRVCKKVEEMKRSLSVTDETECAYANE